MLWFKLQHDITTHPKFAAAGPVAGWFWLCGLSYCVRHLTDGFIPDAALKLIGGVLRQPAVQAKRLVDAGLWERVEGGYQVHEYLTYQLSRAEVEDGRAKRRAAGRIGGQRSGESREAKSKHGASPLLQQNRSKREPDQDRDQDQDQDQSASHEALKTRAREASPDVVFRGKRLFITAKMHDWLIHGLGSQAAERDWFAVYGQWDDGLDARNEAVTDQLEWLKLRMSQHVNGVRSMRDKGSTREPPRRAKQHPCGHTPRCTSAVMCENARLMGRPG